MNLNQHIQSISQLHGVLWSCQLSLPIQLEEAPPSYIGGGVCGGEVLHAETNHLSLGWRWVQGAAGEDLATGFPEVLRQEGIEDWVNTRVSVRQAVRDDTKDKGGVIQGEGAELHPHGDDVVGHPADGEGGDDQKDRLSRLQENREQTSNIRVPTTILNYIDSPRQHSVPEKGQED